MLINTGAASNMNLTINGLHWKDFFFDNSTTFPGQPEKLSPWFLPNGISFRPTALAGCDRRHTFRQTDITMVTRVAIQCGLPPKCNRLFLWPCSAPPKNFSKNLLKNSWAWMVIWIIPRSNGVVPWPCPLPPAKISLIYIRNFLRYFAHRNTDRPLWKHKSVQWR